MSKRDSRVLRYAIMNATYNGIKSNVAFKEYYNNKRAEGQTNYNTLKHFVGKLVKVI